MADEATYTQKTFGQVETDLETAEAAAAQTTTTTSAATETTQTTETAATETAAATTAATTETTAATTEEIKENVSEFSLGGETTTAAAATTQTQATTTETKPVFNLDEEIKKIDRKELLKKAGVNDFIIDMDDYVNKGGKAEDLFNARGIDYNKVSDEDLVKGELKKKYPGFDVDELFLTKYKDIDIELETDPDRKRAEMQLKMDAFEIRQAKIQQQQSFKIPDTPILQKDEAYEQWKAEQESRPKLVEKMRNVFMEHPATKTLHESKRVTISLGEGVEPFNFNIDRPDLITQNLTDEGETWGKLTSTATGEPDVPKQQLITLFAYNPQKFIQDIFKYGVSTGERKLVAEGQNAQKPQAKIANMPTSDGQTVTTKKFGQLGT